MAALNSITNIYGNITLEIRKYIQDMRKGGQPNIETFFYTDKIRMLLMIGLFSTTLPKKQEEYSSKNSKKKGKKSLTGQDDVNWERCYEDAITKQAFLVSGSDLLCATGPRLRQELSRRVEGTGSSSAPAPTTTITATSSTENQNMEEDGSSDNDSSDGSDDEGEEARGSERGSSRRKSAYTIPPPVTIGLIPRFTSWIQHY
ncbi:hypothetical protein INT45_006716 [Circinella minor]|uniref:Uncharacterized protein n=1 Tax=Circinella minor TaxID=1195481 RepID=A0A8H7S5M6_9FUNG|nr:hypothetical protein INT45_006716 [Circinella minor]